MKKGREARSASQAPAPPTAPGKGLHLDGSRHQWFQDQRWYDLIEVADDASSETYYAQLVEKESTRTVMAALKEGIEHQGRFCALYRVRGNHFFETPRGAGRWTCSGGRRWSGR